MTAIYNSYTVFTLSSLNFYYILTAIYLTSCNCPVCGIETSSIECILVTWDKVYEHGISERYIWTWYTCSTNRATIGKVISLCIVKSSEQELWYIFMQKAAFLFYLISNFELPIRELEEMVTSKKKNFMFIFPTSLISICPNNKRTLT